MGRGVGGGSGVAEGGRAMSMHAVFLAVAILGAMWIVLSDWR